MSLHLRTQISFPAPTAIPEDLIVNTWHHDDPVGDFNDPVDVQTAVDEVLTDLPAFYDQISALLASALFTSPVNYRVYLMEDPEPRVPLQSGTFNLDGSVDPALPREVAACISFRAAQLSGANAARRRGRVYIGPLVASAVAYGTGRSLLTAGARTTLATAAGLLTPSPGGVVRLCVFSRSEAQGVPVGTPPANAYPYTNAELEAGYQPVVAGWVDNNVDTQRRRGSAATERTTFA